MLTKFCFLFLVFYRIDRCFFPVQRLPDMQRSYSVGKTSFDIESSTNSNSNTPTVFIKKSPTSMNDDTRILGRTATKIELIETFQRLRKSHRGLYKHRAAQT